MRLKAIKEDNRKDLAGIFYTLINTYTAIYAPKAHAQCFESDSNEPIFKAVIIEVANEGRKTASYAVKSSTFAKMPLKQLNQVMIALCNEVTGG